jgi:hypothetical protein
MKDPPDAAPLLPRREPPYSSRVRPSEPFPVELKAALDGVEQAQVAVERITMGEDLVKFLPTNYAHIIIETLKIEVSGLLDMVESLSRDKNEAQRNRH